MLEQILKRRIRSNYNFGPKTSFGVGGRVSHFFIARNEKELIWAIALARHNEWPHIVVGGGSNIVVSDGLIDLFVIRNMIFGMKKMGKDSLEVGSGENWTKLVRYANDEGLAGIENMYGVPGTLGGAIFGNAGCYGQEVKDVVLAVKIYDGNKILWLSNKQCKFQYRDAIFSRRRNLVILAARLKFKSGTNRLSLRLASKKNMRIRREKFGNVRCPGTYFKNIILKDLRPKIRKRIEAQFGDKVKSGKLATAALIEAVGLCSYSVGGVKVADHHGGLVVNTGGGKASESKRLVKKIKEAVFRTYGVVLVEEVVHV